VQKLQFTVTFVCLDVRMLGVQASHKLRGKLLSWFFSDVKGLEYNAFVRQTMNIKRIVVSGPNSKRGFFEFNVHVLLNEACSGSDLQGIDLEILCDNCVTESNGDSVVIEYYFVLN
jgi:hypothetical protein